MYSLSCSGGVEASCPATICCIKLGAVGPRIVRTTTTVTVMATEALVDEKIVVLSVCGVVLRDFTIIDLCKVYYFICKYLRYLLSQVQNS